MEQLVALGSHLNELTTLVAAIPDAEEQRRLRKPIGEIMSLIYTDLMNWTPTKWREGNRGPCSQTWPRVVFLSTASNHRARTRRSQPLASDRLEPSRP
jgi:hypothetical protein